MCINLFMKTNFILTVIFLFILTGCIGNGVQSKLDTALSKIEHAEKYKSQMSSEDWTNLEVMMDDLENDLELKRDKYNDEQIKEFGKIQGRYTALVVKKGLSDFQETIKDLGTQMEGFIEGVNSDTINK